MHLLIDHVSQALESPAVQAITIILATFVLEDAATVETALLAAQGRVDPWLGGVSLYAGIVLGDLGLYLLGRAATSVPVLARRLSLKQRGATSRWMERRLLRVVIGSRFVPGARLPTYLLCGYLKLSVIRFALGSAMATSVWTTLLFCLVLHFGKSVSALLGIWQWTMPLGLVLVFALMRRIVVRHRQRDLLER